MQSIWNLRTWYLQGCKRYRPCVVAVLDELENGSIKRLEQPPRPQDGKTLGRAQRQLLMDGTTVKSAFALLSTKVTKEGLAPILPELLMFGKVP